MLSDGLTKFAAIYYNLCSVRNLGIRLRNGQPKKETCLQGTLDAFIKKSSSNEDTITSVGPQEFDMVTEPKALEYIEHTETIAPSDYQPQPGGDSHPASSDAGAATVTVASSTTAVSVSPYDVGQIVRGSSTLSDSDKIRFIDNCLKPSTSDSLDSQYCKSKKRCLTFLRKWLDQHKWLAYSENMNHKGGWCLPCLLFLSDHEKELLGVFVKTPFRNYNKSKEFLSGHEEKKYHKICIERAGIIRGQIGNIESRIDVQINQKAVQNARRNEQILPFIVNVVMLCAKQQVALRGHRDDKVDFAHASAANEGNFIAVLRLLAESNPTLKEHLTAVPKNARYTSKTVQSEILNVATDLFRDYFRKCLDEMSLTKQHRKVVWFCQYAFAYSTSLLTNTNHKNVKY